MLICVLFLNDVMLRQISGEVRINRRREVSLINSENE